MFEATEKLKKVNKSKYATAAAEQKKDAKENTTDSDTLAAEREAFQVEKAAFAKEKAAFKANIAKAVAPSKQSVSVSDAEIEQLCSVNTVISNARASVIMFPPVPKATDPEEMKGKLLLPGENDISKYCWNEVKSNPTIKLMVRAAILKNMGEGVANPILRDWTKMSDSQGKKLIAALDDIAELNKIKSQVTAKGLRNACEVRIEELAEENEQAQA